MTWRYLASWGPSWGVEAEETGHSERGEGGRGGEEKKKRRVTFLMLLTLELISVNGFMLAGCHVHIFHKKKLSGDSILWLLSQVHFLSLYTRPWVQVIQSRISFALLDIHRLRQSLSQCHICPLVETPLESEGMCFQIIEI